MRYNKSFPLSTNGFIENLQEDYRRIFYSSYGDLMLIGNTYLVFVAVLFM